VIAAHFSGIGENFFVIAESFPGIVDHFSDIGENCSAIGENFYVIAENFFVSAAYFFSYSPVNYTEPLILFSSYILPLIIYLGERMGPGILYIHLWIPIRRSILVPLSSDLSLRHSCSRQPLTSLTSPQIPDLPISSSTFADMVYA
jgi:hypothetical protein